MKIYKFDIYCYKHKHTTHILGTKGINLICEKCLKDFLHKKLKGSYKWQK